MRKNTSVIYHLTIILLISLSPIAYGEKQDINKPATPADPNTSSESKSLVPQDYQKAVERLTRSAEEGDANAQFVLGWSYYKGLGFPQDYKEAVNWYTKAAEQGNADAQYNLGGMYSQGKGVFHDYKEAVKWYTRAAEQGDAEAQFNLGVMYAEGEGVPQDYKEAVKWYTKAADKGYAKAQCNLGVMYHEGKGVLQDYKEAVKWYTKAAEQNYAEAQHNLGSMYYKGEGVPKDYKEAMKWYTKAAEQGYAKAQFNLGFAYYISEGVPQDYNKAVEWYTKAAEQGDAEAQSNLGIMYSRGDGVPQDYKEAVKWYTKAAEQGYAKAQYNLGMMYSKGKGVSQDYKEAAKWWTKAAEQGEAIAQSILGGIYEQGIGVPEDYIAAYKWYILAAAQGEKNAAGLRDLLRNKMSSQHVAEAQRLAREFKPILSKSKTDTDMSILQQYKKDRPVSTGTGFFITADGFFVTAYHLVNNAREIKILTEKGLQKALLIKSDPANDIAILKVEDGVYSPLTIKPSLGVKSGDEIFTVGFPNVGLQGFEPKYTKGNISSLTGFQDDPRYFQISIPVQTGNSGGPLVNKNGDVIGVVVARLGDIETLIETGALPQNVNYAIKSSYVLTLLETMPQIYRNLKSPSQKEAIQADLVEQTQKSVCLVLCY